MARIKENTAEDTRFIESVGTLIKHIKDGDFAAKIDTVVTRPALVQLRAKLNDLQQTLGSVISINGQDVLRLLETFKNNNFTARLDDSAKVVGSINALGVEIASMLKVSYEQSKLLEEKSTNLNNLVTNLNKSS
ncbi:MAG: methyl-accepting chemotaxis protein, partial [Helicobacteraceae bacterium]